VTKALIDSAAHSASAGLIATVGNEQSAETEPCHWRRRDYALLATFGLLLGLQRAEARPDSDILWSARYGKDLLSTWQLPHRDTYSWTAHGTTWIPNSWGWNVVLGIGYRAAGILGLWTIGIALAVGLALTVARAAARVGAAPTRTAMVWAVLGGFALVVVPRGQAIGYILMFCVPPLLPSILYGDRRRAIRSGLAVCALEIIWINLHTSGVLGPLIVACGGSALLAGSGRPLASLHRAIARLTGVVGLAAAACLATPYGAAPVRHIEAVRRASVGLINEWDRPGFGTFAQMAGLIAIAGAIVLAVVAWRSRRFDTAAILGLLAVATGSAVRFAPMLIVFAVPEIALALGRLRVRAQMLRRIVAAGGVTIVAFIAARSANLAQLDGSQSRGLITALPHSCRLLNDYVVGNAVILFRPDVRVSIDSRIDMYGRAAVLANESVLNDGSGALDYVELHGVNCVLAQSPRKLIAELSQRAGWRVAARDSARTLLVRTAG
jgi:hypothetical protein